MTPSPSGSDADESSAGSHDAGDLGTLASDFAEVARLLQAHTDTDAMLDEVVDTAVRLIPGTDEASISVVTGHRTVTPQHPTSDLPRQVDKVQTDVGQGPCLDAVYRHRTVHVPDMATEQRWPQFAHHAAALGAASMLSFRLYVEGDNLGALNLYSRQSHGFDEESEQVGLLFASHAAVAFADAQQLGQLQLAIETRDLIGQAKGVLVERYSINGDQAFRLLARISQATNQKLRTVADELVTTRQLRGLRPPDSP